MKSLPPPHDLPPVPADGRGSPYPDYPAYHLQSNLALGGAGLEDRIDFRDIWRKLWRARWLIVLVTMIGTLAGIFITKQLTPVYTAGATIMLDNRQPQVFETEAVLPSLVLNEDIIAGEVEVLTSRELARRVAAVLNLVDNPEFNADLADGDESWIDSVRSAVGSVRTWISATIGRPQEEDEALTAEEAQNRTEAGVIDTLIGNLEVKQVGESPVIRVAYSSESPRTAKNVANTIAHLYIQAQLDLKSVETRKAREWLVGRIAELQQEVEEKERRLEALRAQSGIFFSQTGAFSQREEGVPVASQQVAELSSQRVAAILERQRAEAELQENAAGEVQASPVIQGLRLREEELSRELSAGLVEYGPRHPVIQNLREGLRGVQASIASEEARILAKLESAVRSARQREAELDRSLQTLTSKAGEVNAQLVEVRALERDVGAKRTLLENFLARAQETDQQEGIQTPDARMISQAELPDAPSFPNTPLFVLAALFGSGFIGVAIAFITQSMDSSFHTADEVRDVLRVPLIEVVPRLRGRYGRTTPVDSVIDRPNGHFAEALRNLYMTVFMVEERPQIVQFASSLPGEGKTSLVLAFGRLIASTTDESVVVIDCDLRKSSVHRALGGVRHPGLVDYLKGEATLDQVVQVDERSGMRFIASGSSTSNPTHLLRNDLMDAALADLKTMFDVILFDTTPALAVADLRAVQPYVDATVFVVRWRTTPRSAVNDALRVLRRSNKAFSISGALFNAVDIDDYKSYDSAYSYGLVNSYYRD